MVPMLNRIGTDCATVGVSANKAKDQPADV